MKKIFNQLKNVDFFSVTYTPAISDGFHYNHSSVIGGIISLIIGALSLIYCIYYLYLWWSYQLLPKVTQDLSNFSQDLNLGLIDNRIQIFANDKYGSSPINPFKKDEIIFIPLIFDLSIGDYQPLFNNITDDQQLDIKLKITQDSEFKILFIFCDEQYLNGDLKCASEEIKQNYFDQIGNELYSILEFTTLNPSTFESQQFIRIYSIQILPEADLCSTITLYYELNNYQIDKAFLFSTDTEDKTYISNAQNFPQYSSKSFCEKYYLPNTFGIFWIVFEQQYRIIQIQYPPISEVFASIGSIISILFSVKYLILMLNLSQMRQSVLDDIMRQYYPEIRRFDIVKNCWGKIKSVKFDGLQVELSSFLSFQKQIHSQMACKLNYKNLLYEISRFQFILMSMKRRKEIEKVHRIGIKVPMKLSDTGESYIISEGIQNQMKTINFRNMNIISTKYDILSINDALILSQNYHQLTKQTQNYLGLNSDNDDNCDDIEENGREKDFYDVNYIQSFETNKSKK
ncbi:unnamed protein product [Paramecium sonneborni]|uniref:Transmembrane protein n=1 Tax=Paramecium sonneborni TaxID=65129 RepID=A0A8S1NXY7_9CILI|nr:unnamed protein product [Paramecium sonneborni]